MWETGTLNITDGNVNGAVAVKNSSMVPQKVNRITMSPTNFTLRYALITENMCSNKQKCTWMLRAIYNRQMMEMINVHPWWTDKQNVKYLYNGILLSHKKLSTDRQCNILIYEPWKHYAERSQTHKGTLCMIPFIWSM